ncbi:MAG TPA: hypothetical protein VKD28_07455 [Gemmatimonadales bacterium]|nr:hypothetical protein [Gemmatimonadales bacterium]
MSEWICRKCGQRHSAQQWLLNAEKKCHGCGALAVTPDNDPTYTPSAPTIVESVNESLGQPPIPEAARGDLTLGSEPLPEEEEDEEEETNEDEEIRQERVKLAEARRKAKPKPKPKKRK